MIEILQQYGPLLLRGLGVTILLAIVGTGGGFILSLALVSARTNRIDKKRDSIFIKVMKWTANALSTAYITIFRGTPMIVQAMVFYYGIKMVVTALWWNPLSAGLIIVTLNTTAYIAEIIRGNIAKTKREDYRIADADEEDDRNQIWTNAKICATKHHLLRIGSYFLGIAALSFLVIMSLLIF